MLNKFHKILIVVIVFFVVLFAFYYYLTNVYYDIMDDSGLASNEREVSVPTKEEMMNYDYNQSLNLANEYLKSNSHFKPLNLSAEPTRLHDAYMLKESQGSLVYEFRIKPNNNATSEIKDGRIWINVVSGLVRLIDVTYTDEVYVTGLYKRHISVEDTISIDVAMKHAQDFASTNQINLNDSKFLMDRTDDDYLGIYLFIWKEEIGGVEVGTLDIQIHKDGKFKGMIYDSYLIKELMEPIIQEANAKKIAANNIMQTNKLRSWDIKVTSSELIVTPSLQDLKWSKKILAWRITIDITNSKKSNEMNVCKIIVLVNADNGDVLPPSSYAPCYIT